MRALVTGADGFVGRHLSARLASDPANQVRGFTRRDGDLRDPDAVKAAVASAKPDAVFHLAAQSSVPASWTNPGETIANNVLCEKNVLDAVLAEAPHAVVVISSSSEVYGKVAHERMPVKETEPLSPVSPYGLSKAGQEILALQMHKKHGLAVVIARGFSQIGPGQAERFVAADFARQVALVEAGRGEAVRTGNLDAKRDFLDVRDAAGAYVLLAARGVPGEAYNVASGVARDAREILDAYAQLATKPFKIEQEASRLRPNDVPLVVGDASKLKRDAGWAPKIAFEKTLSDVLNEWRGKVASGNV